RRRAADLHAGALVAAGAAAAVDAHLRLIVADLAARLRSTIGVVVAFAALSARRADAGPALARGAVGVGARIAGPEAALVVARAAHAAQAHALAVGRRALPVDRRHVRHRLAVRRLSGAYARCAPLGDRVAVAVDEARLAARARRRVAD